MAGNPSGESSFIDRGVARWMDTAGEWPRTALAVLGFFLILSVLALPRFAVDSDSSKMLAADLPAQQRAAALNEAFPGLRSGILVIVSAPGPDAADLAVAALEERLRAQAGWIESVFAPSADPFLVAHGFLYRDVETVEQLFSQLSRSSNLIARLRTDQTVEGFFGALDEAALLSSRAEVEPGGLDPLFSEAAAVIEAHVAGERHVFGWTSLLERDAPTAGVTRVVTVTPRLDLSRLSPARPALDAIDAAVEALPPDIASGVTVGVTGEPALRAEEMQSVFGTIEISTLLSLGLVALLLRLALRATGRSVVAMISLLFSLILTAGFAAVAVGTLNLVSVAFIVLMVGLGIDFAIHILAHIAETRRTGAPPAEAVHLTGRRTGTALVLSVGTTMLAFLAFSVTDFAGMAQLGIIGAAGTVIAFLTAATLIPAVIAFRPRTAGTVDPRREPLPAVRRMRALPWVVLALGAAAIWPATHVRFDADPMALRDPGAPSVLAFRSLAGSPQTTPYRANVLAPTAQAADEIAARFEDVPGVARAVTVSTLVPSAQDQKLMLLDIAAPSIGHAVSGAPTAFADPAEGPAMERLQARLAGSGGAGDRLADAIAAYREVRNPAADAALAEDLFRSFPMLLGRLEAMLTADYVTAESLPSDLRARYVSPSGVHRVEVLPEEDLDTPAEVASFARAVERVAPEAAGGPVQLEAAGATVGRSVLLATLLAALATGVLAWIATRRVGDTVAILFPLAIAGTITAAASVLLGMPFNYANVIVLPLMLGLGVDSGVHIALRERRAPGAVFATSTPRAVLFSALTTIAAFGTLALSDHRGTASMGVLLSISILAAVGSVLGLTPPIMRWMSHR